SAWGLALLRLVPVEGAREILPHCSHGLETAGRHRPRPARPEMAGSKATQAMETNGAAVMEATETYDAVTVGPQYKVVVTPTEPSEPVGISGGTPDSSPPSVGVFCEGLGME